MKLLILSFLLITGVIYAQSGYNHTQHLFVYKVSDNLTSVAVYNTSQPWYKPTRTAYIFNYSGNSYWIYSNRLASKRGNVKKYNKKITGFTGTIKFPD